MRLWKLPSFLTTTNPEKEEAVTTTTSKGRGGAYSMISQKRNSAIPADVLSVSFLARPDHISAFATPGSHFCVPNVPSEQASTLPIAVPMCGRRIEQTSRTTAAATRVQRIRRQGGRP